MQVKDFKKNINVTIFNPNKSLHGKILVKMVHKINQDTKNDLLQTNVRQPGVLVSEKVNHVHSLFFLDQKTIRVLLSKCRKRCWRNQWIKMKQ